MFLGPRLVRVSTVYACFAVCCGLVLFGLFAFGFVWVWLVVWVSFLFGLLVWFVAFAAWLFLVSYVVLVLYRLLWWFAISFYDLVFDILIWFLAVCFEIWVLVVWV